MPAPKFQPSEIILIYTTAPNAEVANTLAIALVERKLAACVNFFDTMRSVYRWEGVVQSASEVAMLIKTTGRNSERIKAFLDTEHPAKNPCCLIFKAEDGLPAFLQWLAAETA